jgi:peroxiredoxin
MISDRTRRIGRIALNVLLGCAVVAVVVQNISLMSVNRSLKDAVDKYTAQIQAGQKVKAGLTATGADNRLTSITLPASEAEHLLIITFSPACPACQANQDEWTKLARGLKRNANWRVLWVSRDDMDSTVEYCRKHQIQLSSVVAEPPYRTYLQLGLSRVPNTLVVGPGGIIQKVWPGQLVSTQWKDMFAYLNIPEGTLTSAAPAQ